MTADDITREKKGEMMQQFEPEALRALELAVLWSGIKDQDSARGEILNAASRGDAQHTITYDDLLTAVVGKLFIGLSGDQLEREYSFRVKTLTAILHARRKGI